MSQIPPVPDQPGSYPPFAQPLPPGAFQMQPTQVNAWSITALALGAGGFCLPVLPGLLAVVFGILGIRRSKTTRSGRGMSIAGIMLGIVGIAVWVGFTFALIKMTAPVREAAHQFVRDLASGNMAAVQADTDGSISPQELQSSIDIVKPHGAVADVTCQNTSFENDGGETAGVATFGDKSKLQFQFSEVKADGKWRISKVSITPMTR